MEQAARELSLRKRYGISMEGLRDYAGKLDKLVRPVIANQLLAAMLNCLPSAIRRQFTSGGDILLFSRMVQTLIGHDASGLATPDLARLTDILTSIPGRPPATVTGTGKAGSGPVQSAADDRIIETPAAPTRLAEAVRQVYGLSWPPAPPSCSQPGSPAPPAIANPSAGG
jgi:hypothetical protein